MNKKWSEMSPAEKKKLIVLCICAAIALVFIVLDLSGTWKNEVGQYMLSAYFVIEGAVTWKKSKKMAILDIVLGIVLLAGTF